MSFDPSARYTLVEQAIKAPGRSFVTGTPTGPFVDTGRDVQFSETGRVYITLDELREMAEGAGIFDTLRAELEERAAQGAHQRYKDGVRDGAELAAVADRLGAVADRLRTFAVASAEVAQADDDDDAPVVLVTDGEQRERINPFDRDGAEAVAAGDGDDQGGGSLDVSGNRSDGDARYRI